MLFCRACGDQSTAKDEPSKTRQPPQPHWRQAARRHDPSSFFVVPGAVTEHFRDVSARTRASRVTRSVARFPLRHHDAVYFLFCFLALGWPGAGDRQLSRSYCREPARLFTLLSVSRPVQIREC